MTLRYRQSHPYIDWRLFTSYVESNELIQMIKEIDILCDTLNCNAYIVGGTVRDFFLGRKSNDMDVVIEGNGLIFSQMLGAQMHCTIKTFEQFLTATLQLPSGQKVDFITSRREEYTKPGSLPIIYQASLYEDLRRRDFSINCMAIQINSNDKGRFFDLFGGLQDLKDKKIRVLHDDSFIDDPTRTLRAVKYAQRFDFTMDTYTKELFLKAITGGHLSNLSSDRLYSSFIPILIEDKIASCLEELHILGVLKVLFPFYSFSMEEIRKIDYHKIEGYKSLFCTIERPFDSTLLKLLLLFSQSNKNEWLSIRNVLNLNKKYSHCGLQMIEYREKFRNNLQKSNISYAEIYQLLCPLYTEVILCYMLSLDLPLIQQCSQLFLLDLRHTQIQITGEDLYALGVQPGKIYGLILERVLMAKLNKKLTTYEDELAYARFLLRTIDA